MLLGIFYCNKKKGGELKNSALTKHWTKAKGNKKSKDRSSDLQKEKWKGENTKGLMKDTFLQIKNGSPALASQSLSTITENQPHSCLSPWNLSTPGYREGPTTFQTGHTQRPRNRNGSLYHVQTVLSCTTKGQEKMMVQKWWFQFPSL